MSELTGSLSKAARTTAASGRLKSIQGSIFKTALGRDRVSSNDIATFATQLSVMLEARVSLQQALEVLIVQTQNDRLKEIVRDVAKVVRHGNPLHQALMRHPRVFDPLFVVTVEVGQETGRLAEVLAHLAEHLEKMANLKRKLTQAMTYPVLVASVAFCSVMFLLVFIVPSFAELFSSFQKELPPITQLVVSVSGFVTEYGWYAAGGLALTASVLYFFLDWRSIGKKVAFSSLRLPVVGEILIRTQVARFCRTLATLLGAQVSLVKALEVSQRSLWIEGMRHEVTQILRSVRHGRSIADPLNASEFFPPMVSQMIAVGEETSELDRMLFKVAAYYERELDAKIDVLSSLIEPVVVLLLGFVVAGILISMYLPMFELVGAFGGG
jgi:type IV pilus assembly protein PilC